MKLGFKLLWVVILSSTLWGQKGSHEKWGMPLKNDSGMVIRRTEFVYSFNTKTGFSNWVLQRLGKDDYGDVPRYSGQFYKDSLLPKEVVRPTNTDYQNSGYDKGHAVRSEERTRTEEANRQTFVMSNVFPQTPDLNRGPWLDCERWVEKMCKDSSFEFWIVIGAIYERGHLEYLNKSKHKFLVPQWTYKVMLIKKPNSHFDEVGVLMPNVNGIRNNKWPLYIISVSKIEQLTGYTFFPKHQ